MMREAVLYLFWTLVVVGLASIVLELALGDAAAGDRQHRAQALLLIAILFWTIRAARSPR